MAKLKAFVPKVKAITVEKFQEKLEKAAKKCPTESYATLYA